MDMAKQTWIWSIPDLAGVCSSVSPSSTYGQLSSIGITPKQLMFLKLYPRANPYSFTGESVGSSES